MEKIVCQRKPETTLDWLQLMFAVCKSGMSALVQSTATRFACAASQAPCLCPQQLVEAAPGLVITVEVAVNANVSRSVTGGMPHLHRTLRSKLSIHLLLQSHIPCWSAHDEPQAGPPASML